MDLIVDLMTVCYNLSKCTWHVIKSPLLFHTAVLLRGRGELFWCHITYHDHKKKKNWLTTFMYTNLAIYSLYFIKTIQKNPNPVC